jgi:hypothetical protein
MQKKWFTRRETAEYIGCDIKKIKKLSVNGWIKSYKIFNLIRFRKRELDYFLKFHQEKMS